MVCDVDVDVGRRMVSDVNVDIGRSMVFGFEERREQMEKQRRKREKRTKIMRERREKFREKKWNKKKIYIYILQYCNSVELHCSSITKKFAEFAFPDTEHFGT